MTATSVTWASKAAQRGFTPAQNAVLFDERLPVPARLLYVQLAHYAWRNRGGFPTQEEIAANMGVSDRQLRRYAAALEERWLLDRRERGRGQSVEYMLHEPSDDYLERASRPSRQAKRAQLEVIDGDPPSSDTDVRPSSDTSVRAARTLMSEPSSYGSRTSTAAVQDVDLQAVVQDEERLEDPAAAKATPELLTGEGSEVPVADRRVRELVMTLHDADGGSPGVVIPQAHGLPADVFEELVERTQKRRGGVGLLMDFIRITRAERAAAISAQLAADLGQTTRAYVPAPWGLDSLKRDDPERYVRLMASVPTYPRDLLAEAVADAVGGDGATADRLERLFDDVRAGLAPAERLGSPEQERERWVRAHADDPDVDYVIDAWSDVDDVEREQLHALAERVSASADESRSAA